MSLIDLFPKTTHFKKKVFLLRKNSLKKNYVSKNIKIKIQSRWMACVFQVGMTYHHVKTLVWVLLLSTFVQRDARWYATELREYIVCNTQAQQRVCGKMPGQMSNSGRSARRCAYVNDGVVWKGKKRKKNLPPEKMSFPIIKSVLVEKFILIHTASKKKIKNTRREIQ